MAKAIDVLIVDDNPDVLDFLIKLLNHHGYSVHTLEQSKQAAQEIRELKPKLIILDVLMPELDGYSLLQQIKQDDLIADTPIIIHSGKSYDVDQQKALTLGAVSFIPKPSRGKVIVNEVKKYLEV